MFGMDQKKSSKAEPFLFDLEKELANPDKRGELIRRVEMRILMIKELLRKGCSKEEFECLGVMMHGYRALAVVLGRAVKQATARAK